MRRIDRNSGVKRILKFTAIGCTGLFGLVVIASALGAIIGGGGEPSSPPERAEKREGVEQAEKEQSKQPPQEVEKEEPDAGADEYESDDGSEPSAKNTGVKITRVVDGDTIEISPAVDGKDTVRLIGIDAPEDEKPGCGAQPLAQAATDQLANWKGSKVKLEFDEDRTDRYGRLLAYVTAHAFVDIMLNEDQLLGGLAQLYIVPPNTKYEDRLREVQEQAKKDSLQEYPIFDRSIWTLDPVRQGQLADHGNGIGKGEGACPSEPQPQNTTLTTASSSASPNPSPNPDPSPSRNPDLSGPNAPGTSPSTASPTAGGGDIDCDQVGGPVAVPPGDPNNLDADGDGIGCEPPPD